jgi:hypothetical protein
VALEVVAQHTLVAPPHTITIALILREVPLVG